MEMVYANAFFGAMFLMLRGVDLAKAPEKGLRGLIQLH